MKKFINVVTLVKTNWIWLIANVVGISIFLIIESALLTVSAPPNEPPSGSNGISFVYWWFVLDIPLLVVFTLLNIVWLIRILDLERSNRHFVAWLLVCLAWLCAILVYRVTFRLIIMAIMMLIRSFYQMVFSP